MWKSDGLICHTFKAAYSSRHSLSCASVYACTPSTTIHKTVSSSQCKHNASTWSSHNAKLPSGVYNAGHLYASSLDVCFANAGHWAWYCTDCDHIFEIWTLISKCRKLEDKNDDEEECRVPFLRSSLELNYSWRPWCVLWQPRPVWWSKCLRLHLIHSSCAHHCRERIWTCLWAAGPHQCRFDKPELKIVVELAPAP
jgi:hypothetical protein